MPTRHRATSDAPGTRPWLEAGRKCYGRIPPGAALVLIRNPRQNGMLAFYLRADDATAAAR